MGVKRKKYACRYERNIRRRTRPGAGGLRRAWLDPETTIRYPEARKVLGLPRKVRRDRLACEIEQMRQRYDGMPPLRMWRRPAA